MVFQLVYHSRFAGAGTLSTLSDILDVAARNNGRDGITGFLIFDKTSFIQVLEGDEAEVRAAYDRIAGDSRHDQLSVVAMRDTPARAFPDWSMGGFQRSHEVQDIYRRHGLDGRIEPEALDADTVLALAKDLLAFEQSRRGTRILHAGLR